MRSKPAVSTSRRARTLSRSPRSIGLLLAAPPIERDWARLWDGVCAATARADANARLVGRRRTASQDPRQASQAAGRTAGRRRRPRAHRAGLARARGGSGDLDHRGTGLRRASPIGSNVGYASLQAHGQLRAIWTAARTKHAAASTARSPIVKSGWSASAIGVRVGPRRSRPSARARAPRSKPPQRTSRCGRAH